jgi:deoxycytidylate deaminase
VDEELRELLDRERPFVIGLTGAFGSGCTTAAKYLAELDEPYTPVRLSDLLRAKWKETQGDSKPTRKDLQRLGDESRAQDGSHALVMAGLAEALGQDPRPKKIALDALRNVGEVRWLQRELGENFALLAMYADAGERYRRYQAYYASLQEFEEDDQRDQAEEEDWGQQVGRCVDNADVLVLNELPLDEFERDEVLRPKLERFVAVVEGRNTEYAEVHEVMMNMAFAASHGSKCLKRQVGAVIASGPEPVATGYNENPDGLLPCVEQFQGTCFRDRVRHDHFKTLAQRGFRCPYCGKQLARVPAPPWVCEECGGSLDRAFFPDRAMAWCTALHAEERAIINAGGRDLRGATIYSTTAPCTLCAEKIIHAGIAEVVFVDAYPDKNGLLLFEKAGVSTRLFEGVRSRNFYRYFLGVQEAKEREAVVRIKKKAEAAGEAELTGALAPPSLAAGEGTTEPSSQSSPEQEPPGSSSERSRS